MASPHLVRLTVVSILLVTAATASAQPNDSCSGALPLTCGTVVTINNGLSTPPQNDGGPGDPELPPGSPSCQWNSTPTDTHHTIWYSFTATATSVEIETCTPADVGDTILALYSGSCGSLVELACGEDECPTFLSRICYNGLTVGNDYLVMVGMPGSFAGFVPGDIELSLLCPCPAIGVPNDTCATATVVGDGTVAFDTSSATTDGPDHPTCAGFEFGDNQVHRDVWFDYIAPCSGTLLATTCEQLGGSSTFDTRIAIYQSGVTCPVSDIDLLDCNDDDPVNVCGTQAGGFHSTLQVPVMQGERYFVRIGGFSDADFGSGTLRLACGATLSGSLAFSDETSQRLIVDDPLVGAGDVQEKDYAWGDVDQDGDVDLVVARKEPFNTPGRFRNVLFMNEGVLEGHAINGVLRDRTDIFAANADDGGNGMLDLTSDRDIALVDVNGDTWLDIITSTTYGGGLPKTISHPRVYINLGESGGVWQGFRYEEARTPTLPTEPNFCGVGFGDVTGDSAPDLYFVEYNNTLEDRLWINDGSGNFTDESTSRLTTQMLESDFGVHAVIADINGDGFNDIIKDRGSTPTTPPLRVTISYNDPLNVGNFNIFDITYNGNPYHVEVGDLNNDDLLDLVIDDDGIDRYLLNQGNDAAGVAQFQVMTFPPESNLFGGNIVIRDLDRDGFKDVLIADVDVDCCGCTRAMHIWRNNGDLPNVTFTEDNGGLSVADRTGTHDIGVFDINGDQWLDLVIGTCTGTRVFINQVPSSLVFSYPNGIPGVVPLNTPFVFQVQVAGVNGTPQSGSGELHYSIDGAPVVTVPMAEISTDLYEGTLPAAACFSSIEFYVSARLENGTTFFDPRGAPTQRYGVTVATGTQVLTADDFETPPCCWTITSQSLASGQWTHADPNGTLTGTGLLAAPDDDAQPEPGTSFAFVTDNGPPFGAVGTNDVDGGPTDLVSPSFDLSGQDGVVSYSAWFFCDDVTLTPSEADVMTVSVSNDGGGSWVTVETIALTDGWESRSFRVGEFVLPTADLQVRFRVEDTPNNSITEAGVDLFRVESYICESSSFCPGDLNYDRVRDAADIQGLVDCLLATRGDCELADMNGNLVIEPGDVPAFVSEILETKPCP